VSISAFTEDWQVSQFWVRDSSSFPGSIYTDQGQFTDETAEHVARALLSRSTAESALAVISAPTVYIQVQNLIVRLSSLSWKGKC
jgi:hypothetical protein